MPPVDVGRNVVTWYVWGGLTVIVNVCTELVFTPPLAVPPLSCAMSVMVAVPNSPVADVKVSVPFAATAGGVAKSVLFVLPLTLKATDCVLSPGPAEISVAQFGIDCGPAL